MSVLIISFATPADFWSGHKWTEVSVSFYIMWPLKNSTSSSENNDHWAVVVGLANEGHCIPSEEAEGSIRCKMNPHSLWFLLLLYNFIWWFPSLSIRSVNMSNTSNGKFWANCCCCLKFFIDESVALCFIVMGMGFYQTWQLDVK